MCFLFFIYLFIYFAVLFKMIEMEVCSPARTNNGSKQEEERGLNPGAGLELTTTLIQAGPPTAYFTTVPWNPFETTQSKIRKPYLLGS